MHAARIEQSDRLQRVARYLADGIPRSTLEIIHGTGCCAINSIVAELRENGIPVSCTRVGDVWYYQRQD
jgi:hypothetical protein